MSRFELPADYDDWKTRSDRDDGPDDEFEPEPEEEEPDMESADIAALVERLRDRRLMIDKQLREEAADALEAMQAERDMLLDELVKAGELIDADLLARAVKAEDALANHILERKP